jgi:hypothetical protein
MINTENYETKEFSPAPSAHVYAPQTRIRKPKTRKSGYKRLTPVDVDFLSDFIKVSAFYVEDLEDYVGEELIDFWESREHALQIITDLILQDIGEEVY